MTLLKEQRGLSLISLMVVIAVVVFFAMVGVKSLPVYLNHYKIKSIMHSVAAQPGMSENSAPEIRESFARRFDIDMVDHVNEQDIKITGSAGAEKFITLDYEVRVHMFYNVDTVYVFKESVSLGS